MTDRADRDLVESDVVKWRCDECGTGYSSKTAAHGCCGTGEACLMDPDDQS